MDPTELERTRPFGWELLLLAARLEESLAGLSEHFNSLVLEDAAAPTRILDFDSSCQVFTRQSEDSVQLAQSLGRLLNHDLAQAFGPPDTPADPQRLHEVTRSIGALTVQFLHWERAWHGLLPHPALRRHFDWLRGITILWTEQLLALPLRIRHGVANYDGTTLDLKVHMDCKGEPPRLDPSLLPSTTELEQEQEFTRLLDQIVNGIAYADDATIQKFLDSVKDEPQDDLPVEEQSDWAPSNCRSRHARHHRLQPRLDHRRPGRRSGGMP